MIADLAVENTWSEKMPDQNVKLIIIIFQILFTNLAQYDVYNHIVGPCNKISSILEIQI